MELLLDYGTDSLRFDAVTPLDAIQVDPADNTGATPLIRAVVAGKKEVVEMLLAKGANIAAKDFEGNTPLHHACYEQKVDIALLLAEAKADYTMKNAEGKTPLDAGPIEIALKLKSLKEEH